MSALRYQNGGCARAAIPDSRRWVAPAAVPWCRPLRPTAPASTAASASGALPGGHLHPVARSRAWRGVRLNSDMRYPSELFAAIYRAARWAQALSGMDSQDGRFAASYPTSYTALSISNARSTADSARGS